MERLVEIKRAIGWQLDVPRGELRRGNIQVGYDAVKVGEVHVGQVDERAALEAMVSPAPSVASQHQREFVGGEVVGRNVEVYEVAGKRYAHSDARLAIGNQPVECGRGKHLARLSKLRETAK